MDARAGKRRLLPGGPVTVIGLSGEKPHPDRQFANQMNQKGHDLFEATLHACRQRYTDLMTSLAFIFGVLPMAGTQHAGAGSGGRMRSVLA
ncbi:efflux RND transporter permease subunit [Shigella flexneri]